MMIVTSGAAEQHALELREMLRATDVLAFASAERAARAYANVLEHWSRSGRSTD
jgi:hypothetical protein